MATDDEIEAGCRAIYGKHWDGPIEKMPKDAMKNIWRKHVRIIIDGVDSFRKNHGENL